MEHSNPPPSLPYFAPASGDGLYARVCVYVETSGRVGLILVWHVVAENRLCFVSEKTPRVSLPNHDDDDDDDDVETRELRAQSIHVGWIFWVLFGLGGVGVWLVLQQQQRQKEALSVYVWYIRVHNNIERGT